MRYERPQGRTELSHAHEVTSIRLQEGLEDPRIDVASGPVVGVCASVTEWTMTARCEGVEPEEEYEEWEESEEEPDELLPVE